MEAVLSLEAPQDMLEAGNEIARKMQRLAKSRGEVVDVYEAIAMAQAHRAAQGDTAAATWVRDSAGDKPTRQAGADWRAGIDRGGYCAASQAG